MGRAILWAGIILGILLAISLIAVFGAAALSILALVAIAYVVIADHDKYG